MNIGIIGSGEVGQALAKGMAALGHQVMIGTRNTTKKELDWVKERKDHDVQVGSYAEAAEFAQLVFLAVAWHATEDVLPIIRPQVSGKIVIDLTNPLLFGEDDAPELALGFSISAGELVQQALSDSHVVKTLNTINYRNMIAPDYGKQTPVMLLCGNNDSAKKFVRELLQTFGWQDVQDIGDIKQARLLEPMCAVWIAFGLKNNTWEHAFAILRK